MYKIIAYGSLRPNHYNFKRIADLFGETAITLIEPITLKGFQMHDLGYYPAVTPNPNKSITAEILLLSPKAYDFVDHMEQGAGYIPLSINTPNHKNTTIFIMKSCNAPIIQSGDWNVVCTRN